MTTKNEPIREQQDPDRAQEQALAEIEQIQDNWEPEEYYEQMAERAMS